jgi:hypothetical protein
MISDISNLSSLASASILFGGCNCDTSNSSVLGSSLFNNSFDIVILSLLNSVSKSNNSDDDLTEIIDTLLYSTLLNNSSNLLYGNSSLSSTTLSSLESLVNTQTATSNKAKIESTNSDESVNQRIDSAVSISSQKYGVDENLIRAIIKVESDFNPNCVSSAGAKGLMQLMPENCEDLGVNDPFNIEENIDAGTRHIKEYLDRYDGDVEMALMAYNGGPTRMANRGVKSIDDIYKMPKETQNYVPKVMSYYNA